MQTLIIVVFVASWTVELIGITGVFETALPKYLLAAIAITVVGMRAGATGREIGFLAHYMLNQDISRVLAEIPNNRPAIFIGNYWIVVPMAFQRLRSEKTLETYSV